MKELYYFSRNYVEFGTFSAEEIADFRKRGILKDHDYVRSADTHHWEAVSQWLGKNGNGSASPDVASDKPAATKPKATRKKAAATKPSKKVA